jgi:hypothetical protein
MDWERHDREMREISESVAAPRQTRLQREWRQIASGERPRVGLVIETERPRRSNRRASLVLVHSGQSGR